MFTTRGYQKTCRNCTNRARPEVSANNLRVTLRFSDGTPKDWAIVVQMTHDEALALARDLGRASEEKF